MDPPLLCQRVRWSERHELYAAQSGIVVQSGSQLGPDLRNRGQRIGDLTKAGYAGSIAASSAAATLTAMGHSPS
jgi:hypothetical protein